MLLLFSYFRYLETNTKILSSFLEYLIWFIKKCSLGKQSVDQFPTIIRVGSYIWNLVQTISEANYNYKVLSQSNFLTLVKAMRSIYSSDLVSIPFSNIKIAVNILETEEVTFTLVTNKEV